ncbi:hypothetical protein MBRA1_002403 [Malassezia brasiliensis]|uniref:Uncharacterized protein n=1 Tax=Malassezia brasiliensis TaxID=1821822 RepID=A0AAF0DU75_9BASI|nr:hypothetical protein MBRA1_002403 [Malassezia brasiliensis]
MHPGAVPTSDPGDEVGGLLDDGTRLATGDTVSPSATPSPVSASDRIRAAALRRAAAADDDIDGDIVSPDALRLKVLDASSDESDLELDLSPTKRPRRAAAQRAPRYNVKLSLTKPASDDVQRQRGRPQPVVAPSRTHEPRSIATLLRQKQALRRKGLDTAGLSHADALAVQDARITDEIAAAQHQMNATHVKQDMEQDAVPLMLADDDHGQLLRLLARDAAHTQHTKARAVPPLLWTTSHAPLRTVWPPELAEYARNAASLDTRLAMGTLATLTVPRETLVTWLVHERITSRRHSAHVALQALARTQREVQACFWDQVPRAMRALGANAALIGLPTVPEHTEGPEPIPCAPSPGVHAFWETCAAMPCDAITPDLGALLVLYAASLPPSVASMDFARRLLSTVSTAPLTASLVRVGLRLPRAHQLRLVRALPGTLHGVRADVALCLATHRWCVPADRLAAAHAFCTEVLAAAVERNDDDTALCDALALLARRWRPGRRSTRRCCIWTQALTTTAARG